jgi:hypothetical protein
VVGDWFSALVGVLLWLSTPLSITPIWKGSGQKGQQKKKIIKINKKKKRERHSKFTRTAEWRRKL